MLKRLARQSSRPIIAACEASSSKAPRRHASTEPASQRPMEDPSEPVVAQLTELVNTLSLLKEQSRRPAPSAYFDLIQLASQFDNFRSVPIQQGAKPSTNIPHESLGWSLTSAALADAAAGNVELPPDVYDVVASFTGTYPGLLPHILRILPPNYRNSDAFLSRLCRMAIHDSNLEQLLLVLNEMWDRGAKPSIAIITHGIRLACDNALPRIAADLAQEYDKELESGTKVPTASWVRILMSSAENSYSEGVELAWQHTVVARHYTPDEGLLANVLNVAARTGNPDMVTRVLDVLPVLSVQPEEYHLVALMEAYVKAGRVPQALQVLSMVRSVGLAPTRNTAQPILDVLTTPELVDQAFFALEDMKAQGQKIDITAFNVLVEASSRLEDVQRVRATQIAAPDLGVVPDIDTFNSALAVCIPAKHRALGDTIMEEMKQAGISPNGQTYHNMILICLTQAKYDDAFFYLETSKSEGFKPQAEAYRQLAMRCSSSSDGRAKMVIAEMESLGYKMEFPREHQRGSEAGERGGRREFGERRGNTGRGASGIRREGGGGGAGVSNRFVAGARREGGPREEGLARREGGQRMGGAQPREGGQRREGGPRGEGGPRAESRQRNEGNGQRRRTDGGSGSTEPTART